MVGTLCIQKEALDNIKNQVEILATNTQIWYSYPQDNRRSQETRSEEWQHLVNGFDHT